MPVGSGLEPQKALKVALSDDANLLPLLHEILCLSMLRTLFVPNETMDILIADHKNACVLCNSSLYLTARACSRV